MFLPNTLRKFWESVSHRPSTTQHHTTGGNVPSLEGLETRNLLAVTATLTGTDVAFTGDGANDSLLLQVNGGGFVQHNIVGGGFASNTDMDSGTAGIQTLLAADATGISFDGMAGTDTFRFVGSNDFDAASAKVDIDAENVMLTTPVIKLAELDSAGAGGFIQLAGVDLDTSGSVKINHTGATGNVTLRGSIDSSTLDISGRSITQVAGSKLTSKAGEVRFTSSLSSVTVSGEVEANGGNVVLDSTTLVSINGKILSDGSLLSTGTTFLSSAGSIVDVDGPVDITHTGGATLRGGVEGSVVDIEGTTVNLVSGSTTTSTTGNIVLTTKTSSLTVSGKLDATGDVLLDSKAAVTMNGNVTATGSLTSTGTSFMSAAGSIIDVDGPVDITHTGGATLRGAVEGSKVAIEGTNVNLISGSTTTSTSGDIDLKTKTSTLTVSGKLDATGDVLLDSNAAVTMNGNVTATGSLTSTGTSFMSAAGSIIDVDGPVNITHTGGVTVRGTAEGSKVAIEGSTVNLIDGSTTTSTSGDIDLTTKTSTLTVSGKLDATGNVTLDSKAAVTISATSEVTATGNVTSSGTMLQAFDGHTLTAGSKIDINHSSSVFLRGVLEGASIEVTGSLLNLTSSSSTTSTSGDVTLEATTSSITVAGAINAFVDALFDSTTTVSLSGTSVIDVTGNLTSNGTTFTSLGGQLTTVGGTLRLDHSSATVHGTLDALDYDFNNNVSLTTSSNIVLRIDSSGPIPILDVTGNLSFANGSTITVNAAGTPIAAGDHTIGTVSGTLTLPSAANFNLVTAGPQGAAVEAVFADTSGSPDLLRVTLASPGIPLGDNLGFESDAFQVARLQQPFTSGPNVDFNEWYGDDSYFADAENGVAPRTGTQMLRFRGIGGSSGIGGDVQMNIDASAHSAIIDTGTATIDVSGFFNTASNLVADHVGPFEGDPANSTPTTVSGDPDTYEIDNQYFVQVFFFDGDGTTLLGSATTDFLTDFDPGTWEELSLSSVSVPTGTRFIRLQLKAVENVFNDEPGTDFWANYADDISVTLFSS